MENRRRERTYDDRERTSPSAASEMKARALEALERRCVYMVNNDKIMAATDTCQLRAATTRLVGSSMRRRQHDLLQTFIVHDFVIEVRTFAAASLVYINYTHINSIAMATAVLPVATPFNALPDETLREIFLTLALTDIPSLHRPQGWFLQVNGVCRRWRKLALEYSEIWAISAGSFPSDEMTNLTILRASRSALGLCFDGHFENHAGAGYVLTEYQLSLIEKHCDRLRSFVHDEYYDWSDMFYRLESFPKLEMARIWDEGGPDMWPADELIGAPRLRSLYMNNVLVPFNAPSLVHLRVDMDHQNWSSSRTLFDTYEPEGCEAIPRVFSTREFIAFLQRSPLLERLVVTDMPLLRSEYLPSVADLRAELPRLRILHLGGKSMAMGDFLRRLTVSQDIQVFIDTDVMDGTHACEPVLANVVSDCMRSAVYDSFRMSITPSHNILLQTWSSETSGTLGGFDLDTSLGFPSSSSPLGPAFSLRLPSVTRDIVQPDTFDVIEPRRDWRGLLIWDKFQQFKRDMAKIFYERARNVLQLDYFHPLTNIKYLDYTDAPWDGNSAVYSSGGESLAYESHHTIQRCFATHHIANWSTIEQLYVEIATEYHFRKDVEEMTIVNFPCAAFFSEKRYDEKVNERAWDGLRRILEKRHEAGWTPISLKLAESNSEMSEMARLDERKYVHAIAGSYEDAVRTVTQRGYETVAPYLSSFEDLRQHTWP